MSVIKIRMNKMTHFAAVVTALAESVRLGGIGILEDGRQREIYRAYVKRLFKRE
jgi:hypothetical protein